MKMMMTAMKDRAEEDVVCLTNVNCPSWTSIVEKFSEISARATCLTRATEMIESDETEMIGMADETEAIVMRPIAWKDDIGHSNSAWIG